MNILFITPSGFDTFYGSNHLNKAFIIDILEKGHNLTYIQTNAAGPYKSIPTEIEKFNNVKIINIDIKPANKNNKIGRYLSNYNFQKKVKKTIKDFKNFDLVYLQSSGVSTILVNKLSKLDIPIIFNIQDLFPESLLSTGMIKKGVIYNFFKRKQIKSFKKISKFTVISPDVKNALIDKYFVPDNKIEVVYNWYSETDVKEVDCSSNKFVKKFQLEKNGQHIIQYAGNLGYVLDYNFLLSFIKKMERYDNFKFQIIGNGSNEEFLKNEVKSSNLKNVDFFDIQPNDIVSDIYSFSDLQIVPLKKDVIYHSVPSKVPIVMRCNRPVLLITDSDSEYFKSLDKHNVAICLAHDKVEEAVNITLSLFEDKSKYNKMVKDAFDYAYVNFSASSQINKIYRVMSSVVNKGYNKNGVSVNERKEQ